MIGDPPDQPPPYDADHVDPLAPPAQPEATDGVSAVIAVPWRPADGFVLAAWSLMSQLIVGSAFVSMGAPLDRGITIYSILLISSALTLGVGALYLRVRRALSWQLFGPARPRPVHVLIGVGVGIAGFMTVTLLIALADLAFGGLEPPDQQVLERVTEGGLVTVLSFLTAGAIAPVVEELVFRGVLFQALRQRVGLWPGLLLSSVMFGIAHVLGAVYLVALALFGVWLAAAFHRSGTLVVPIVAHGVFNLIALTLAAAAG